MGNFVSKEKSNSILVDELHRLGYIKSASIQNVFRSVNRGHYVRSFPFPFFHFPFIHDRLIYDKETSWKHGNLELSSPIFYATVLENLELQPGMSFLNVGSGSGYLSTMCGLLVGRDGNNHGIEVNEDLVIHAKKRLEQFLKTSPTTDDFAPPEIIIGNFLDVTTVEQRYDRIYCGAACPQLDLKKLLCLLKVRGACVVPTGNHLEKITRQDYNSFRRDILLKLTTPTITLVPPSGSPVELPSIKRKGLAAFQTFSEFDLVLLRKQPIMCAISATNLDRSDEMHATILEYVNNSQEPSHNFRIWVKSIIKIQHKYNDGFVKLLPQEKTRMMLWHGTKFENLPSILENGLVLPSPYQKGLLQGQAIYFADRVSKSAQYCDEQKKPSLGQDGILFLCDVMVGMSYIAHNPNPGFKQPPQGFDSVTCPGRRAPSPSQYKHIDGVVFPSGKSGDNQIHSNCLVEFNEYAIYDPDLIDIKYILHFGFTKKMY